MFKAIVDFLWETYKTYRVYLPVFIYAILLLKFSPRWIDSSLGIPFGIVMLYFFFKMDIRDKLYLLVILLPFAESQLIPRQMFGIRGLNPVNFVFFLVFIVVMIDRKWQFKSSNFNKAIAIFILMNLFSAIRGLDAMPHLEANNYLTYFMESFLKPMQIFLCGILAYNVFKEPEDPNHFLRVIKMASLMFGVWILYRGGETVEAMRRLSMVTGLHKNSVGFMFAVLLAMNLATENFGARFEKVFSRILTVVYVLVIMFTFSRQGYVSCVLIFLYYCARKSWKMLFIFFVGFVLFWQFFMPFEVKKRIYYGSEEGAEMGLKEYTVGDVTAGRMNAWAACKKPILDNVFFGQGKYSYVKLISIYRPDLPAHPHSAYLQGLLDMGVIGFSVFVGFYVFLMMKSWFLYKRSKSKFASAYSFGFFVSVGVFMIQALTGFRFYPNEESYFIWLFLGGLMWVEKNQQYLVDKGM